jgi:hypothetical protein
VVRVRRHALVEIPVLQVGYNIKHFVCVEAHCGATGHRGQRKFNPAILDQPFHLRQRVMGFPLFHGEYLNLVG